MSNHRQSAHPVDEPFSLNLTELDEMFNGE